jgi:hypothetical protein
MVISNDDKNQIIQIFFKKAMVFYNNKSDDKDHIIQIFFK